MGHPLSMDLRSRLLAAIDNGLSCRAAAARFGVALSTAIRWYARRRDTGAFDAKPQGGDVRSRRVEERAAEVDLPPVTLSRKMPPAGMRGIWQNRS